MIATRESQNRWDHPPQFRLLHAGEVIIVIALSACVHLGLWWAYQHQVFMHPEPLQVSGSKAQSIEVALVAPTQKKNRERQQKQEKTPPQKIKLEHENKPEPKTETRTKKKPETKPKPKPEPKPKAKPRSKPKSKPEPTRKAPLRTKPESTSHKRTKSKPEGLASTKVTPAVSSLRLLNNQPPRYPPSALRRHEQGQVKLKILVTPQGTAGTVTVVESSGYRDLDQAAVAAVKKWHFKPAKRGNTPVPGYALQIINFNLSY